MKSVVVVDDTKFMRVMLSGKLKEKGYEVVAMGENGLEAVELYDFHRPDFVTLDITMPELDGISALKRIMAINPSAKVMMVSAMGQQGMVMEAITSGAKGFIVKPFTDETLAESFARMEEMA